MSSNASMSQALMAVNRFGLGAREGELLACAPDPQGWLLDQVKRPDSVLIHDDALETSKFYIKDYSVKKRQVVKIRRSRRTATSGALPQREFIHDYKTTFKREREARQRHAVLTDTPFNERWTRFWCNHFTVSGRHPLLMNIVGSFEREAIRPNVFTDFKHLLQASTFHPAMQIYLDNNLSFGPNSRHGKRLRKSYNENLAREILELHTLGLKGGYTPDDIIAFALALTGWRVGLNAQKPEYGETYFEPDIHEPGARKMLGRLFSQEQQSQAKSILNDIAARPATAQFIADKIARHFISSKPPKALTDHLANVFLESEGDLTALSKALIRAPQSWEELPPRYKTPNDYVISAARALGLDKLTEYSGVNVITYKLGQADFMPPSPEGWSDTGSDWINGENLIQRMSWLSEVIDTAPNWLNAEYLCQQALGENVSQALHETLKTPLPRKDLLRAVLMSPEFLKR